MAEEVAIKAGDRRIFLGVRQTGRKLIKGRGKIALHVILSLGTENFQLVARRILENAVLSFEKRNVTTRKTTFPMLTIKMSIH